MNNKKRDKLRKALDHIGSAIVLVEDVRNREEISVENYPENFQDTPTYEAMEEAVENMDEACDKLDDAKSLIEGAVELIESAINTRQGG